MRNLLFLGAVLFLLISVSGSAQEKPWQEFSLKEGNFKVLVPVTPVKFKEGELDLDLDKLKEFNIKPLAYSFKYDNDEYMITFLDFSGLPGITSEQFLQNSKKLLDDMQDGELLETKAKIVSEKPLKLDGFLGSETLSVTEAGRYFLARSFVIPKKAVVIGVTTISKKKIEESANFKKFFDSLVLVGIEKNVTVAPVYDLGKIEWKKFAPSDGGFSVLLPGTPEENSQTRNTKAGDVLVHAWVWGDEVSAVTVNFADFDQEIQDQKAVLSSFDSVRNNFLKKFDGCLISEASIDLNGIPGRAMVIDSHKFRFTVRVYMYRKRLFTLTVVTPKVETVTDGNRQYFEGLVTKVFNSFAIQTTATNP